MKKLQPTAVVLFHNTEDILSGSLSAVEVSSKYTLLGQVCVEFALYVLWGRPLMLHQM